MGRLNAATSDASRWPAASVSQYDRVQRRSWLSFNDGQDEIVEQHEEPQAEGSAGAGAVPGESGGGYGRPAAPRTADEYRARPRWWEDAEWGCEGCDCAGTGSWTRSGARGRAGSWAG